MANEWTKQKMEEIEKRAIAFGVKEKDKDRITYTTVIHQAREELKLSLVEYCICDIIHRLGGSPISREMGGWCYSSKQHIANCLGINKKTVERAITKLLHIKLIEKEPTTRHLRATNLWYLTVESYREKIKSR